MSEFWSFDDTTNKKVLMHFVGDDLFVGSVGSVGDDLFETLEDCSIESYSSQVWNVPGLHFFAAKTDSMGLSSFKFP